MEYLLLCLFFQNNFENYHSQGDFFPSNNLQKLLNFKNIAPATSSEMNILFEIDERRIFEFLKTNDFKWLVIKSKNKQQYEYLNKEIKNFGHEFFLDDQNLIIVLKKNIQYTPQNSHHNLYANLDSFLNFQIIETQLHADVCFDEKKQLLSSLASNNNWVYIGKEIPEKELLKCQMFAKMRINFIECTIAGNICGYFIHRSVIKDFWIFYLSKNYLVESILNLNNSKLVMPIFV